MVEVAVLVGLVVGFVAGYQSKLSVRFPLVVLVPLIVAALEIAVNVDRFGAVAMVVWTAILIVLTLGATAVAMLAGRRVRARRHPVR